MPEQQAYPMRRRDKRSSRTRKALVEALFSLLEQSEFQKITVNDICAEAEVSRPTYYTYFDDKYSLLRYCVEGFYEAVVEDAMERGGTHRDIIEATLDHLEANGKAFHNLLLGETNRELSNIINTAFYELNYRALSAKKAAGWKNQIPIEITSLFRAGGSIAIMAWWVSQPHDIPKEAMVSYLLELNGSEESPFQSKLDIV